MRLYSPYQARDILLDTELSGLKVNCDLSHWVCVCEKLFNADVDARDAWWPAVLDLVASHCYLVHGRVGHAEGPQVVDPTAAPDELQAHIRWWQRIWEVQKEKGVRSVVITEHGPEPYQTYDWYSKYVGAGGDKITLTEGEKSAILWGINSFVKDSVQKSFPKS
jgi:hypothetical protein